MTAATTTTRAGIQVYKFDSLVKVSRKSYWEGFHQGRGVRIWIQSLKNAWIRIRFVLRGWIWIWSISDWIRNPVHVYLLPQVIIFLALMIVLKLPKKP